MKKVFAYAHTHWDREWYREFEGFRVRLIDVFDDILEKLQNNELESFYFDGQTAAIEDYLEIKPEKIDLVKDLIKNKRLYVGPYYCSTDSFLVDAESLIRNLQIGFKKSKELGCEDYIAYHADTFGHSAQLPEIVKYFGLDYGIFWRGCGELPSEFIFNGLNSTYLVQGYFHDVFSLNLPFEKKAQLLKNTLDKIAPYSSDNILLPIGADHLALAHRLGEQINEVNKYLDDYEIILTTPFEYQKNVHFEKCVACEQRDSSKNFILPGVFSSRIDLKKLNSRLQWELSRITEPFQAICSFLGKTKDYQSEIDFTYKTLIKNQAHDSIYGCGIDGVHSENLIRYGKVIQAGDSVLNRVKRDISGSELVAFNLSNFKYSGAVKVCTTKRLNGQLIKKTKGFPLEKIYDINQIPITEDYTNVYEYLVEVKDLEPFSVKKIDGVKIESSLKVSSASIENDRIMLKVEDGKINVFDKINYKQYCDFIKIVDRADIGDSYNFGALENDKKIFAQVLNTKIIENGAIRSALKITFSIRIPRNSSEKGRSKICTKHILEMTVYLENQSEYIEFETKWNNKSLNHLLQVEFNFDSPVEKTVSDDLTGIVERTFDCEYDIHEHVPAPRGVELKYNIAPSQKFVWHNDTGIICRRSVEYEIYKNTLLLTILRATGTISNPKNPTRGTPAGPPLPTPDLQMLGHHSDSFAIAFNKDYRKMFELSERFQGATIATFSDFEYEKLFDVKNKNLLVSALKTNKNNDLIIRFVNKTNEPQYFEFSTQLANNGIYYTDSMESTTDEYKPSTIAPNQFVTVKLVL